MKKGKDQVVFNILAYVLVGLFAILCLVPFYLIVVGSFTSESTIVKEGYSFFLTVKNFSTEAYHLALKNPQSILHAYGVTIFVTVVGTLLSIFMTTIFNGGLVPWYLLCTQYLNFNNHIYSLIIPGLFSVWNMIIAKSFMKGIPFEITEAAKIDGAGDFYIYLRIILPMAKPLVATLTLFIALAYWNDWYNCMLFMSNSDNWNLQYTLQNILNSSEALKRIANQTGVQVGQMPSEGLKLAMTVIATGPIVLLYPFLQKYFVKGLTLGAVKG